MANKNTLKKPGKKILFFLFALLLLPVIVLQAQTQQIFKQNAAESKKPNIVIILTDDQPDDTLKYLPAVRDKLGDNGVTFTNAYVTTGLCCPSRSSILTGQYAHNHGVITNFPPAGGIKKFHDKETLPVWLKNGGYKTGLFGKYLNDYDQLNPYIPPGWTTWVAFDNKNGLYFDYKLNVNGKSKSYGKDEKDYSTDVLAEEAVQFIKKSKEPFFVYYAPHAPHGSPKPAPRDEKNCQKLGVPRNPAFNEDDVSDKPSWVKKLPKLSKKQIKDVDEEYDQKICTLKAVDRAVDDIIKALGNKRNNTAIIFLSDNNYSFGNHRWDKKECQYEVCVAVDMVISYPPLTKGKKVTDQFGLNIDLAPTILDLAGLPIPPSVDGKSLVPLLKDPTTKIHDTFLLETYNDNIEPPGEDYGIRNQQYKYLEASNGEKELYDMQADPNELSNLAKNPELKGVMDLLALQLYAEKKQKTGAPGNPINPTPTPEPGVDPNDFTVTGNEISRTSSNLVESFDQPDLKCTTPNGHDGNMTEIGCIPKDPIGFAAEYYRFGLGLIGGLSVLFIIIGGYQLMTSGGDPRRIHNGKTYIFYATFGLLLAIFGFVFLEVIAVDILKIPGFAR